MQFYTALNGFEFFYFFSKAALSYSLYIVGIRQAFEDWDFSPLHWLSTTNHRVYLRATATILEHNKPPLGILKDMRCGEGEKQAVDTLGWLHLVHNGYVSFGIDGLDDL